MRSLPSLLRNLAIPLPFPMGSQVHGGEAVCAHLDCPRNQAMLLMSLVVGSPVLRHEAALSPLKLPATARSFGRLMVLSLHPPTPCLLPSRLHPLVRVNSSVQLTASPRRDCNPNRD